jgi:hypothetical protein
VTLRYAHLESQDAALAGVDRVAVEFTAKPGAVAS